MPNAHPNITPQDILYMWLGGFSGKPPAECAASAHMLVEHLQEYGFEIVRKDALAEAAKGFERVHLLQTPFSGTMSLKISGEWPLLRMPEIIGMATVGNGGEWVRDNSTSYKVHDGGREGVTDVNYRWGLFLKGKP